MIRFDKVCKSYGKRDLFKDLSFCIHPDDKCGFVGRNGSGKTTLFRLLTNRESIDSGLIQMPNDYTLGYLDQHISFSKNTILEEAMESLKCEEWEKEYKAETVLFGLGFKKEDMQRAPEEFSGGYQIRVHLAKVLLSEPSCLLLDEPTNYLDIVSMQWLKKFLKSWVGAFIIISHDRGFLDSVSTTTLGLHRNKMYKISGGTKNLFDLILKEEKHYESTRASIEKKRSHLESFVKRFGAKASKAAQARSKKKALDKIPSLEQLMELHSLRFSFNEAPFPGERILTAENICFSYPDMLQKNHNGYLIDNLSLSVEKGERIAIVGKNGYGKSTILKLLSQELSPDNGSVLISDNASIGYFGQTNIDRLNPSNTVIEEIASANTLLNEGEVRRICGIMMFARDDAKKKISMLSGGEKSRVLLGKILAKPCNLLLLDEPTNHLDIESIESLLDSVEEFFGAVIIVTHSDMILSNLSLDKLIICQKDEQDLFLGNYEEFLEKKGWPEEEVKKKKKTPKDSVKKKTNDHDPLLKGMKKEINKLESSIDSIEKKLVNEELSLVDASKNGNKEQIIKLSKSIFEKREKIDKLFSDLEKLSKEYEEKKRNISDY